MFSYSAYGIGFHSVLRLPELVSCEANADVEVRYFECSEPDPPGPFTYFKVWTTTEGTFLFWRDVATFLIRDGNAIFISPVPNVETKRLRLILLGAAISILLEQRGFLVFHASAVEIGGRAAIFLGNKGWGKSTMAAALQMRGHQFLADDVVAVIESSDENYRVFPAFPQLKLWSDAITSFGDEPNKYPPISSITTNKHERRIPGRFPTKSIPLGGIYILGVVDGSLPEITRFPPREALVNLISQTYSVRWGKDIFASRGAMDLTRCARLVGTTPVYHLKRPKSLELVPEVALMVEEHSLSSINAR